MKPKVKIIYETRPVLVNRFVIECPHCKSKIKGSDYIDQLKAPYTDLYLGVLKSFTIFVCPKCKEKFNKTDYDFEYEDINDVTPKEDIYNGVLIRKKQTIEVWEEEKRPPYLNLNSTNIETTPTETASKSNIKTTLT